MLRNDSEGTGHVKTFVIVSIENEARKEEKMSKLDLLKLFESFEGEAELADFSPQELEEMLEEWKTQGEKTMTAAEFKRKYFEYHDDVKDKTLKRQDW